MELQHVEIHMKIGVLTFHSALNVGAVLQAYGLQTYLASLGHEVAFIDYQPIQKTLKARDLIGKGARATFRKWEDLYWSRHYTHNICFGSILRVSDQRYESIVELRSNPPDCDAYIAGSDQIWNFGKSRRFDAAYFLDFGGANIRRIAYAASIGQNEILEEDEVDFRKCLKRFDSVSVREASSVPLIAKLADSHTQIEHICDPTFLLTKEQFEPLEEQSSNAGEYVASYLLPHYEMKRELEEAVHYVANTLSCELINLRNPNTCHRVSSGKNIVVNPQQWLGYFKHARFTVCCSFHAVVFSLIYHKPFVVVSPYRNNRVISLLSAIGLSDRCIYHYDEKLIGSLVAKDIDWMRVDEYINSERTRAQQFLSDALSPPSGC